MPVGMSHEEHLRQLQHDRELKTRGAQAIPSIEPETRSPCSEAHISLHFAAELGGALRSLHRMQPQPRDMQVNIIATHATSMTRPMMGKSHQNVHMIVPPCFERVDGD